MSSLCALLSMYDAVRSNESTSGKEKMGSNDLLFLVSDHYAFLVFAIL